MKRTVLTLLVLGCFAFRASSQSILLWNLNNSGGSAATTGGLVYTNKLDGSLGGLFDGVHFNLGMTVWGGPSSNSLSLLGTWTANNDPKGYTGYDLGKFQVGNAITVPGVAPGGTAWIELQMWFDGTGSLYPSYLAAISGLDFWIGDIVFATPTGAPGSPEQLVGMPSVILGLPEPSTFTLFGLTFAATLRRYRKC